MSATRQHQVERRTGVVRMNLDSIQPSHLLISSEKLALVLGGLDQPGTVSLGPVPVKWLSSQIVLTDGHTRAFAAASQGLAEIRVFCDEDDLGGEAYETCVRWRMDEGIRPIHDPRDRVVPAEEYEILWLDQCRHVRKDLEKRRNRIGDGHG